MNVASPSNSFTVLNTHKHLREACFFGQMVSVKEASAVVEHARRVISPHAVLMQEFAFEHFARTNLCALTS
jgi:hypothetical protein